MKHKWKRTGTGHVWVNRDTGKFTYSDECEQFAGEYDSEADAKAALDDYIEKNLADPSAHGDVILASSVNMLVTFCHDASSTAGWWHDLETGERLINRPHVVGEKLMLVVSEVSEAMEGHRKGLMDDKLPHRKMIEVELADAVIRIADLAGALGLDLGGAVAEKLEYNAKRLDHKPESRRADGGKKY